MAVSVTINGTSFDFPETGDEEWGAEVTSWAQSVSQHLLQKTGGTFTLSADVDFGGTNGLAALFWATRSSDPAEAGVFRLANGEAVAWRNNADDGNLLLSANASDELTFDGKVLPSGRHSEDAVWGAAQTTETFTVSANIADARLAVWSFMDADDDYRTLQGADIKAISQTQVSVTFGIAPGAGNYRLVGVG